MQIGQFIGLLLVGMGTGVMAGLFGIGGGLVIVPVLCLAFGITLQEANAVSLTALMLPVGILGVIAYWRKGLADLRSAAWIALALAAGSFGGAYLALGPLKQALMSVFIGFVVLMGLRMLEPWTWRQRHEPHSAAGTGSTPAPAVVPLLGIGALAGVLAGLFGIGGGIVIVPALSLWQKFPHKRAVGTSLAVLLPPVTLPAVLKYHASGSLHLEWVIPVAAGLVLGSLLGARLGIKVNEKMVKRGYGVFLLLMSALLVVRNLILAK
jgi:uncharacterized membrane protein YfcA